MNAMLFSAADNFGDPGLNESSEQIKDDILASKQHVEVPRPDNFLPLFTIIENDTTGEEHHPHVHYIFSDDDPDLITHAALRQLEPKPSPDESRHDRTASIQQCNERYIILDLDGSGQKLMSISSLSEDWQGSATQLVPAPSFDDDSRSGHTGLMLRINGMNGVKHDSSSMEKFSTILSKARQSSDNGTHAAVLSLADNFQQELGMLQTMIAHWEQS